MGIFGWFFRFIFRRNEEGVQQPVKGKTVSKGGPITNNLASNLGVISNHLSNLGEKAREANKKEGTVNVRRRLYKAKRQVQISIGKLNK